MKEETNNSLEMLLKDMAPMEMIYQFGHARMSVEKINALLRYLVTDDIRNQLVHDVTIKGTEAYKQYESGFALSNYEINEGLIATAAGGGKDGSESLKALQQLETDERVKEAVREKFNL